MRTVRVLVMVLVFAGLVGCGDDGPDSLIPTPTPTPPAPVVTAGTFALSTVESTLITIAGTDLTAFGGAAPQVRLTASAGTPFAGGTSAVIDLPGTVASDTSLTAMSPLASASADFTATVTVVHASGNLAAGTVTFSVPTISGFTPPALERGVAATLDVAGAGFASSTGVVDVVLTAQGGATPFAGGTDTQHVIVGATVASDTQITAGVTIPDIVGVATATITVEFPGGTSIEAPGTIGVEGIIIVTNLNDAGAGSLRAALTLAGSGGIIEFDPALNGPIPLVTQLEILGDVTINGPGAATIQVSGQNTVRVFDVAPGATVEIVGLAIEDGLAENGAGVLATTADLTFRMCEFNGSEGGVIVDVPAATTQGDIAARGGVLAMDAGSLTATDCIFDNNVLALDLAVRMGATAGNVEVPGGILACGNAAVTLENCTSNSDEARVTILAEMDAVVGNVTTKGGFVYTGSGALTLTNLQSTLFSHTVGITLDPNATIGDVTTWGGLACGESGAVVLDGGSLVAAVCDQDCSMDLDSTVGNLALRGGLLYAGSGALTLDDIRVSFFETDIGVSSPLIPGVTRQTVGDVTVLGSAFFAESGAVILDTGDTDTDLDVNIDLGDGSSLGDVRCEGGTLYAGTGTLAATSWDFDDGNVEFINVDATASSIGGVAVAGAAVWTAAATPSFEDCFFDNCDFDVNVDLTTCFADDISGRGVGIFCDATTTDLTVTNCRFQDQDLEVAVDLDSGSLIGSVMGEGADIYAGAANVTMTDSMSDDAEIDLDVTLQGASLMEAIWSLGGCLRADGGAVTMTDCTVTDQDHTPTLIASGGSVAQAFLAYGGGLAQFSATGTVLPASLDLTRVAFSGLNGDVTMLLSTGAVVGNIGAIGGQVVSAADPATLQDCEFADNTLALDCDLNSAAETASVLHAGADLFLAAMGDSTVDECSFDRARLEANVQALGDARCGGISVRGGSVFSNTSDMVTTTFTDCTGSGTALDATIDFGTDARLDGAAEVQGGALFASSSTGGSTLLRSCAFTDVTFDYVFAASGNGPVDYDTVAGGGCLAHEGLGSLVAVSSILDVTRFSVDGTMTEVAPGLGITGDWRIGGGVLLNVSGNLFASTCVLAVDAWDLAWTFDVQTLGQVVTGTVCGTIGYQFGGTLGVFGSSQIVGVVTAGPPVVVGPGSMTTTPTLDPSNLCP